MKSLTVTLLAFIAATAAQQNLWQQCGGIGWTGPTSCPSGSFCSHLNDYYFQCVPTVTSSTTVNPSKPTVTSAQPAHPTNPVNPNVAYWFSFGDSYTQTGFVTNGTQPSIGNPLGNPPYPGYTAVGGVNWIDVATVTYNHSTILTYNYAYGGATIDASLVTPYEPTVLSLTDQVNEFLTSPVATPSAAVPWTASTSLFSFWIGINDIGNSYYESGSRDAFSDTLLNAYFALVQKLAFSNQGGRNFLFINVPPIDRSPLMLAQSASAQSLEKSVIATFNSKLATRVSNFSSSTGSKTWLWDSNAAFTTVLNSPTTYGFVDATSYGNTGDFWGNNYHSSAAAQTIWGQQISQLLAGTIW